MHEIEDHYYPTYNSIKGKIISFICPSFIHYYHARILGFPRDKEKSSPFQRD